MSQDEAALNQLLGGLDVNTLRDMLLQAARPWPAVSNPSGSTESTAQQSAIPAVQPLFRPLVVPVSTSPMSHTQTPTSSTSDLQTTSSIQGRPRLSSGFTSSASATSAGSGNPMLRMLQSGPTQAYSRQSGKKGKGKAPTKKEIERTIGNIGTALSGNNVVYIPDTAFLRKQLSVFTHIGDDHEDNLDDEMRLLVKHGLMKQIKWFTDMTGAEIEVEVRSSLGANGPQHRFVFAKYGSSKKGHNLRLWPQVLTLDEIEKFSDLKVFFAGCRYVFIFDAHYLNIEHQPLERQRDEFNWGAWFTEKKAAIAAANAQKRFEMPNTKMKTIKMFPKAIDEHKRGCGPYRAKGYGMFVISEDEDDVKDVKRTHRNGSAPAWRRALSTAPVQEEDDGDDFIITGASIMPSDTSLTTPAKARRRKINDAPKRKAETDVGDELERLKKKMRECLGECAVLGLDPTTLLPDVKPKVKVENVPLEDDVVDANNMEMKNGDQQEPRAIDDDAESTLSSLSDGGSNNSEETAVSGIQTRASAARTAARKSSK